MRSKRLLTLVVAVCLLISVLAPAAGAVELKQNDTQENTTSTTNKFNDLLLSAGNALGLNTLRDKLFGKQDVEGDWVVTPSDKEVTVSKDNAVLPEHIQQLRKAAEYYSEMDRVSAFVVLEKAPLVEKYSSIGDVPSAETALLTSQQEALIGKIEESVMEGQELDVIAQFTYLTNSVVIETEFGNLEAIASVTGVKSVFLSPVYYPCETESVSYPYTVSSGLMTNVTDVWAEALGYTGSGMTIAVLDTGLDLDHPSFAADPTLGASSWDLEFLEKVVSKTNAAALYELAGHGTLTAEDLYYSAKIPFRFNYATGTTNVLHNDSVGDHGTHVAGIAAANPVEGSGVVGMAPDAQIIVMKVFSPKGGAYMYDILNALEDAMLLGCDVVNMSLGSAAGFSATGIDEIDAIYQRISETDIIVDIAAGNEGTSSYGDLHGNYMNTTDNIDNATVSSPSTYVNAMSVGSAENAVIYTPYFTLADGTVIYYMQSVEYLYGDISYSMEVLAGEQEYVIVDGLGDWGDFYDEDGNSVVAGKIAVVARGELSFHEKAINAQMAGAIGVMIWDNVSEDIFSFGMTTEGDFGIPEIPVILISLEDGQKMATADADTVVVSATMAPRSVSNGGQMSSFSSWGVSPDLHLVPDITGVGGNVYSCYDGGQYGLMSGTSMATPQVAGITALVLQYLKETFPNATETQIRTLADALVMSTAVPVIDSTSGVEASPRQQGAGLINALYAVTAEAYLSVAGSDRPKAELYDNADGTFSFTFSVHNYGDEAKTYTISSSLLCEDYTTDADWPGLYFMAGTEHVLNNDAVTFSAETVTVAPGSSESVTVTINLTEADKLWIDTYFPNGNYVEGFVYLTGEGEVELSLPFMGFYGDWTEAPLFDTGYWYENGFWGLETEEPDANEYYHVLWTDLEGTDWVLGFNPYTGALLDQNDNVMYDPANNVLSPNGDGRLEGFQEIYLSLMRNAKYVYMTYTDENNVVLDEQILDYLPKTMYSTNYGRTVPFVYSSYYYMEDLYDFTDADGNVLPSGTKLTLTITGTVDYGDGEVTDMMVKIPITIDTKAPEIVGTPVEYATEDGNYLVFTIADDSLAYVALMNPTGTKYYAEATDTYNCVNNGDGTYTVFMDVTGCGNNFLLFAADYGTNEAVYEVTFTAAENKPEVDMDALYAYRVYDAYIYYYEGYDYMFAWTTMNKETGEVTELSSDAYEYYALTAAEYAGGYVFAVDAGYNFVVMEPGLWNRQEICNLGVNVIDMAFDEATGTMYITTKTEGECTLSTVDLLTGEVTVLKQYRSQYDMPWTMTFVDGKLYAAKYYYSGLYEVQLDGSYNLVQLKNAQGENLSLVDSNGTGISPRYSQSMTYSEKDGKIYWAYYSLSDYNEACELIVIDPTDWSYTCTPFVDGMYAQEFVGLLTLESEYELPISERITRLAISKESMILAKGANAQLSANPLPWNTVAGKITWSSADEEIAVVTEDGTVVGIGAGTTVITAECDGLMAECVVTVVDIEGEFFSYNYFSDDKNYGNWIMVDMATMSKYDLEASPVEFIAADYNGHDGYIYGYTESGQCYKYHPGTGEIVALGQPSGHLISDMAYDYSTGFMYAIEYDYTEGTTIYYVNMNTGELLEYVIAYDIYLTLACDMWGYLYAISADGTLYMLQVYEDSWGGGGIMPWSTDSEVSYVVEAIPVMTDLGALSMWQSMCYDHNNDVILWTNPETSEVYWIDLFSADEPYMISMGNPSDSSIIEYLGMYVVPEDIPELEEVPVEEIVASDMVILQGASKMPAVSIYPLNATNQNVTYVSADESIVSIENGVFYGKSMGSTEVTATLVDGDTTHTVTFTVAVKATTDNIYGYIAFDLATYGGYYWASIQDVDPKNYVPIDYAMCNGAYMMIYSAEYVDGLIYAYGYDADNYSANFQFMIIDPQTLAAVKAYDMGSAFPFVYDMAFDYTTGTMYAVAGPSDSNSDLYIVDMTSGALIDCMVTAPLFLGLTVDAEGNIYAMANSEEEFIDPWTSNYGNAILYKLDPAAGTCEPILDTGVRCNALASMAYDHDTGYIYWTGMYQNGESGLYLIDPKDNTCSNLGIIGASGSQVTGLMVIADEYPEIPDELLGIGIATDSISMGVGVTEQLGAYVQPQHLDVTYTWSSADESIATVDENGVVTGVGVGMTTITVTVEYNGVTKTATCQVVVFGGDDYFLTYNTENAGFASISRFDSTNVTMLTENEEAAPVSAMVMINGYIYAYDTEGNLFKTSEDNGFVREYIGNTGWTSEYEDTDYRRYELQIADMAWDAANERLLVLAYEIYVYMEDWGGGYIYEEKYSMYEGSIIYEADLTTGALTELCYVNTGDAYDYAKTLAIDGNGVVYTYSTFDDYVCTVDLETGLRTPLTTFQNMGLYGDGECMPMAMTYDPVTDMLYMLWTQSGNCYRMFSFDPTSTRIAEIGNVGYVNYGYGDAFAGLVLNEEHVHDYDSVTNPATCTEDGSVTHTCKQCGHSYTEVLDAHGHSYVDSACVHCGQAEPDNGNPDTGDFSHGGAALVALIISAMAIVVLPVAKKKLL